LETTLQSDAHEYRDGIEESLDPENWDEFRSLSHRMLDDMLDFLASIRMGPAWQPLPPTVKSRLSTAPVPMNPTAAEDVYQEFLRDVMPYTNGNRHPRFWGWVQGNGTPLGMLADMLASGMNPHLAGFDQAPTQIEYQVLKWLTELMGMPNETSGILLEGGTMANVTALVVARHAMAGFDIRENGLQEDNLPRLIFYGSAETHGWAQKAAEFTGLGNRAFRRIDVDKDFRIKLDDLRQAVDEDRRAGNQPFCIIGNAGTVNTAAIDDLQSMADFCRDEKIWFHVDGAFGALARLVPSLSHLVRGMERADSIAFDLHKWMYLPFGVACVLIKDSTAHKNTFRLTASYLEETSRGVIAGGLPFADRGLDLTRSFRALKIWMSLKVHGINAVSRIIEQNVNQAHYCEKLIEANPDLELTAPVSLNIVCFRFAPKGIEANLDQINREILVRVQESGLAVPSSTEIAKAFSLRLAITNHRSKREDFDLFFRKVLEIGSELLTAQS
jgi:aromatic-L-amino-acid/L-tryptophan decarboxylase